MLRSIDKQANDTMELIKLDFRMAKSDSDDLILHSICREALDSFFEHIDVRKIKCILLTGSVANGEGTVIRCSRSIITSDFDFVIYADFAYIVKNRAYFGKLSEKISLKLGEKEIDTHVVFLPNVSILRATLHSTMPNIYEYEFAFASKCVFGDSPSFRKIVRPSKGDALELVFTVVSNLVFSRFRNVSKAEECYIYAKRSLTLLNSLLIFHGFFAKTYEKRMKIAKEYVSKMMFPIGRNEIKILEAFNEFKLSGSFQHPLDSLAREEKDDIVKFQRKFLEKLTAKILYYELENFLGKTVKGISTHYASSFSNMTRKFPRLLQEYSRHSKGRLVTRIAGIIFCLLFFLTRNREREQLFTAFIFHKQPPKVILNILITLLFIYGRDFSTRIMRETFPWIDFEDTQAIQRMFSLWQSAEQSIKLG